MVFNIKTITIMENIELNSPFIGTPWKSDQEIYDFALEKRKIFECDWDEIESLLKSQDLDPDYAAAIVANLKEQEETLAPQDIKKRKWIAAGLSVVWAIIAVLIVRPLAYMMSPEYGRYLFIGIIAIGLSLINQYRKGGKIE